MLHWNKYFLPSCFEIRHEGLSFGYNKKIERMGKIFPTIWTYYINIYLSCILLIYTLLSMYFRVNLKMKKPALCCCFTWIVFIEFNFTVPLLLIRKTWNNRFVDEVGVKHFKKWTGNPSHRGMILKCGSYTPLRIMLKNIPLRSFESCFLPLFDE